MTFTEYWTALVTRNPGLKPGTQMKITVESFRASLEQAYVEGQKDITAAASTTKRPPPTNPLDNIFDAFRR